MLEAEIEKKNKKHGAIKFLIIGLVVLIALIGGIYISIPSVVSSALSGGAVSSLLPQEVRERNDKINLIIKDNLGSLSEMGISNEVAIKMVSKIDFETFENVINKMQSLSIDNTDELIDLLSICIDFSMVDITKLKKEYYSELAKDTLNQIFTLYNDYPAFRKAGFDVAKKTVLDILKQQHMQNSLIANNYPKKIVHKNYRISLWKFNLTPAST